MQYCKHTIYNQSNVSSVVCVFTGLMMSSLAAGCCRGTAYSSRISERATRDGHGRMSTRLFTFQRAAFVPDSLAGSTQMSKIAHDDATVVARPTPSIALSDMVDVAGIMQKTSSIPALMERTIIIGAGMAGLVAAHVASKFSREIIVLEKDAIDLNKASVEVSPII